VLTISLVMTDEDRWSEYEGCSNQVRVLNDLQKVEAQELYETTVKGGMLQNDKEDSNFCVWPL